MQSCGRPGLNLPNLQWLQSNSWSGSMHDCLSDGSSFYADFLRPKNYCLHLCQIWCFYHYVDNMSAKSIQIWNLDPDTES